MKNLCLEVVAEEVDGNNLPIKTSKAVLALLKKENIDTAVVNLQFPFPFGMHGDREGIAGWYRPRPYEVGGKDMEFSKIVFLQESLRHDGNYRAKAEATPGSRAIVLGIKKYQEE